MTGPEWKRLAQLVVSRRIELGMKTTKALADAADLSARMVGDIENHRRTNYSPGARAQIENALEWEPGSINQVLDGADPTPVRRPAVLTRVDHEWRPGELDAVSDAVRRVDTEAMSLAELRSVLSQLGWQPLEIDSPYQPDLLVQRGDQVIAIEIKKARPQGGSNDITTEQAPEAASGETPEGKKSGAADRRNEDDLIEPDPASGVDADDAQSDVGLAGGWRRGGGKSEGRLRREQQDRDAENE
ncbi:hypothetical protein [Gordonia alkanivorans]|uniref:hypothetical protein n=1 Tax=Gordonia alkanivorans TaxID=84096 RepID=UPI0024B803F2|nr:hypothetical protein [Gordonia alkanivorans]MDJ0010147.1 hypothetical protein [Gordonia alkanivorans]MDJ0495663.1 hypothetical protein [Gordonia alkanivorans]